jgi:hypothetical protein
MEDVKLMRVQSTIAIFVVVTLVFFLSIEFIVQTTSARGADASKTQRSIVPIPSGQAAATRKVSLSAILAMDDNAIVEVRGHKYRVGDLRAKLNEIRSRAKFVTFAKRLLNPLFTPAGLQVQNNAVLQQVRTMQKIAGTTVPSKSVGATAPVVNRIVKDCNTNPPAISRLRGTLTPNALIAVDGECLGANPGQLKLLGVFPNGSLPITIHEWAYDHVLGMVTDIAGVNDQPVRVQAVTSTNVAARVLDGAFVARRERVQVPARLIRNIYCPHEDSCGPASGSNGIVSVFGHHSATNFVSDHDTWQSQLPGSWAFDDLNVAAGHGQATYGRGWENGPPNFVRFNVNWAEQCDGGGLFIDDYCWASYELIIYANGPAGVALPAF